MHPPVSLSVDHTPRDLASQFTETRSVGLHGFWESLRFQPGSAIKAGWTRCHVYLRSLSNLKPDCHLCLPSSNWWNVASEMAKPVQPAVLPENGRGELPDERDNEIVIELDRENQYGRTQPRANEPQGNHFRNIQMVHPRIYICIL